MNVGQLEQLLAKIKDKSINILMYNGLDEGDCFASRAVIIDPNLKNGSVDAETGLTVQHRSGYCKGDSYYDINGKGTSGRVLMLKGS